MTQFTYKSRYWSLWTFTKSRRCWNPSWRSCRARCWPWLGRPYRTMKMITWTTSSASRLKTVVLVLEDLRRSGWMPGYMYLTRASSLSLIIWFSTIRLAWSILNAAVIKTPSNINSILLHAHLPLVEFLFFCTLADCVWTPSATFWGSVEEFSYQLYIF